MGEKEFSDLQFPCALTAVDLKEMKEVTIREGKVLDGVMATMAIPGIFPPKELGEYLLVDGMVLNPVPVGIARSLQPNLPVVAVSLSPEPERWKIQSPWDERPANPLLRPVSRLWIAKAFDVYTRSMDISVHMLGELRLQVEEPALLIRPEVFQIGSLDKVDVHEVARLGDLAVQKALPDLKKLKKRSRWKNWLTG